MTLDRNTLALRGIVAALVAGIVNAGVVFATQQAGVAPGWRALTYPPVIFLSVAGAVGAAVVFWLLQSRSDTPERTFVRVAAVVLVVSWIPDLALFVVDQAATVTGVVVLMVMHVVVAAVSVGVLVRGVAGVV